MRPAQLALLFVTSPNTGVDIVDRHTHQQTHRVPRKTVALCLIEPYGDGSTTDRRDNCSNIADGGAFLKNEGTVCDEADDYAKTYRADAYHRCAALHRIPSGYRVGPRGPSCFRRRRTSHREVLMGSST